MDHLLNNQHQGFYVPQELLQGIGKIGNHLVLGIPKERIRGERRLALTPEAVEQLTSYGFHILLESGAGLGINYSDNHYSEAGAEIVETPAEVYQADLILKILPPLPEEVALMRPKSTLLSFVPFHLLKSESYHLLINKRITAISYDYLQDEDLHYQPIMSAMAEIEGYASISIASDLLSNNHGGKGISSLFGVLLAINPLVFITCGIEWLIVALSSGYSSLGAIVTFSLMPILGFVISSQIGWAFLAIALLCLWRHRENIKRLLAGTESKVEWKWKK